MGRQRKLFHREPAASKQWCQSVSIRGYMQARYNRLLETNPGGEREA
ncbi:hypothetical protein [Hymenobacter norwichensis]|nr:hypothetical protein [Hymenobacter norwichensis]